MFVTLKRSSQVGITDDKYTQLAEFVVSCKFAPLNYNL